MLGQIYGRVQIGDQEIRGGRQLVDTPLINPQDNRMVPNTFEGATLVSLPDKDRNYDYSVGYLWTIKQRDSNDFIQMSDALAGSDVVNRGAAFGMVKYRPVPGSRCSHGLLRPGLRQHGIWRRQNTISSSRRAFQIGSSARTSSSNEASEPTCSREAPSRPIKPLRRGR